MPRRIVRHEEGGASGEIAVRDPFQLVRHLARSQPDPRKAVAELIQNALDEQARHILVTRRKEGSVTKLSIRDDGLGVLPELDRPSALEAIAKNIGNSRKRQMSFDERMRAAMLGQFGIGLLGFWNVGHELRMVTRVANSEVWGLSLIEDSPKFEIYRVRDVSGFDPGTWTEVSVVRLHPAAQAATTGTRLLHYLSVELRGQLITHGTELTIEDRLTRKAGEQRLIVKPAALVGDRLPLPSKVSVPGYDYPVELDLFYIGDDADESIALRLAAGGAILLDRASELPALDCLPWSDRALGGVIDFPHLEVPPGSRRGIISNQALEALLTALGTLAGDVTAALESRRQDAAAQVNSAAQKHLAKWFSSAAQLVPHLDWFSIAKPRTGEAVGSAVPGDAVATAPPDLAELDQQAAAEELEGPAALPLFPVGPCVALMTTPKRATMALDATKVFRVVRLDEHGQPTPHGGELTVEASLAMTASLAPGDRITVHAGTKLGSGAITVRLAERPDVFVTTPIQITLTGDKDTSGIPTPVEIDEPQKTWRSRWQGDVWQINSGHPDAKRLSGSRGRMQYLATLLAKEVIARNFARPELGAILEEMVGLLAALEASKAR